MDLVEFERSLVSGVSGTWCGVDEAGRGPLAGPVCAAAVILPENFELLGLNDSKKLSKKKREKLYDHIIEHAVSYGIAFATPDEIDALNILGATYLAMNRAVEQLNPVPAVRLIDGNRNAGIQGASVCVVGGDAKCASIAAASILAKVTRDRFMIDLAVKYPQYDFAKHKGYPTALHYERIREYGPCPEHRMSFLKKMH